MTAPAYATVEQLAAALDVDPSANSTARMRRAVLSASRDIDKLLHRWFYPLTATYSYYLGGGGEGFWLGRDLLSLTAATADDSSVTLSTVTLSPAQAPYSWVGISGVDIDLTGVWGYSNDTESAGALDGAISDTTGTTFTVTDAAKVGIGDLLTIDSERFIVEARAQYDTTANVTGDLTANKNDVSVTVNDGTLVHVGETILVDSEKMLITDIASNTLTVIRAVDGTTLAAHSQPVDVYAPRTLTVERAATGTTAATHNDAAAITRNVPPHPITTLCIAEAIVTLSQETAGYGRASVAGAELRGIESVREKALAYRRLRMAAV